MDWYLGVLRKYVDFSGRARRTEFWTFTLISMIISALLSILDIVLGFGILGAIYALGVLLPTLAVAVRRLHDTDRSGWWLLIGFVPLIGVIVLIVFCVQDSQPGDNAFGPNPKGVPAAGATAAA